MQLELAVASAHAKVLVGVGGQKPSPVPLVSLAMHVVPGGEGHTMVIEMTPGQTRELIKKLESALTTAIAPEGT